MVTAIAYWHKVIWSQNFVKDMNFCITYAEFTEVTNVDVAEGFYHTSPAPNY